MGIMGFLKKQHLLNLQRLIVVNAPYNKLVMSEKQLIRKAEQLAQRQLKIVYDCQRLINTTINPEVFFKRYDLIKEKASFLLKLSPYVKFTGTHPLTMVESLKKKEQPAISDFLKRYYQAVEIKAKSLKTDKAKANQYLKFYESLQPYYDRMNEENKQFIEERKPK